MLGAWGGEREGRERAGGGGQGGEGGRQTPRETSFLQLYLVTGERERETVVEWGGER